MLRYLLFTFCLILLVACEQQPQSNEEPSTQPPTVEIQPTILLQAPIEAVLTENAADAIPSWWKYAAAKPTLVLLSQDPFLVPIPEQGRDDILQLVRDGNLADFQAKAMAKTTAPTLLPQMALSAALEAGIFSKVIWVLPTKSEETELSLDAFRQQLLQSGVATPVEADSFNQNGAGFTGLLRQIPVNVAPFHTLTELPGPIVIHIDLSFIKALYQDEIKTPLHPLASEVLVKLGSTAPNTYGITISHSNQTGNIPLQLRFIGKLLARLCGDPALLNKDPAGIDALRSQALYLQNFYKKDQVLELYQNIEQMEPTDASVKYELYLLARQFKDGDKAIDYLQRAVTLDSAYGLEYLHLAADALDKKLPAESLRMLDFAEATFPNDPFIPLRKAKVYTFSGKKNEAIKILNSLIELNWSPVYYSHIPKLLRKEMAVANSLSDDK